MEQSASTMEAILENVENVNEDVVEINKMSARGKEVSGEIPSVQVKWLARA